MATPQVRADVLRRLLRAGATARVERLVDRLRPPDIAEVLPELEPSEIRAVVDVLFSVRRAAWTLSELPAEVLPDVLDVLGDERVAGILGRLPPDDAVMFLHALPEDRRGRILEALGDPQRAELDKLFAYPESTAGSVMTTRFLSIPESTSAQAAIDAIRTKTEEDVEDVFYVYVTAEDDRLRGVVPIRKLVSCRPETPVSSVMITDPVAVEAMADQEEVASVVAKYNLLAVPVVDPERRLLGVITVDDVIDVIQEEATEDMFRMVGLNEEEHAFSPMATSIRRRFPWMIVNLATAFLAAWVVGLFEESIQNAVALAVFLPVVAGMGGNGGTQTLTIITRGIALGQVGLDTGLRAVARQLGIGIALGGSVGAITALGALAWRGEPVLGLVLFLSMLATMAVAGLAGAAVPLALKALRQDPALGSGVLVTAFTDVCGFLSFLGIGTFLLRNFAP